MSDRLVDWCQKHEALLLSTIDTMNAIKFCTSVPFRTGASTSLCRDRRYRPRASAHGDSTAPPALPYKGWGVQFVPLTQPCTVATGEFVSASMIKISWRFLSRAA